MVWKRPELTRRLLDKLREARVGPIYVTGDAPREGVPGEVKLVEETRDVVAQASRFVPIYSNFAQRHRGLQQSVVGGIDWFFQSENEGIILEDDVSPEDAFFPFLCAGLEQFRNQNRVSQIGGMNYAAGLGQESDQMYFSVFQHIWGFGTWKNRWIGFAEFLSTGTVSLDSIRRAYPEMPTSFHRHWRSRVGSELSGRTDTWASSWNYFCAARKRISVVPPVSLVANIGFRSDATNSRRIPLISGYPPEPTSNQRALSVDSALPLRPDSVRDYYVAMTQWATQPKLLRTLFAGSELVRRLGNRIASGHPRSYVSAQPKKLTVAQRFYLRRVLSSGLASPANPSEPFSPKR